MRIESDVNYETIDWPTRDEGTRFLKTLRERGILAVNSGDLNARMKLVELGLTMPREKDRWLLFDSDRGERALYIFLRVSVSARNQARPGLVVLRFDITRYRSNPLAPGFEIGDAAALFCRSTAIVAGVDYAKGKLGMQAPQLN